MAIRVFGDRRELELELRRELAARPGLRSPQWRPLRLLVPKPIDRLHLAARLVDGEASHLGMRIQSLPGFCLELLAGERPVRVLPRVLARRLARRRSSLAFLVDGFEGGDEVVSAAVERLLAAGLEPELLAPALEALGAAVSPALDRTVDLLELALAVGQVLATGQLLGSWQVPARAVERLARRPPKEEVWGVGLPLHAELDGVIAALLAAGGHWWCESPGVIDRQVAGATRSSRLARLGAPPSRPAALPAPTLWSAGSFEEVLVAVVGGLEEALESGTAPETCTVVYHDPDQGRRALEALARAGIPAVAPLLRASPDGAGRLRMALSRLVEMGPAATLVQWFVAAGVEDREVLAAWRSLGRRTLGDVATVDLEALLGDRRAVVVPAAGGAEVETSATTRIIDRGRLAESVAQAASLVAAWIEVREARDRVRGLAALARLGLALGPPAVAMCREAARSIEAEIPPQLALDEGELAAMAAAELLSRPSTPADGGGVRILPVAAAAEASWVMAIVMDCSAAALEARRIADPLFPEPILRRLESVLPSLVEDRDLDPEEPVLRLSRASARTIWAHARRDHIGAPGIVSALWHWAQSRGAKVVELEAWRPGRTRVGGPADAVDDSASARHQAAVAHTLDHVVGPFGARLGLVAPRREQWWATRLEAAAQCPWRFFLERRLGLGPLLDQTGMGALDTRLVGSLVHTALERLAHDALARASKRLELPDDLEAWLLPLAGPVTSGLGAPLLAAAAAVRGAAFLRAAWRLPQLAAGRVLAAEAVGEVQIEGVPVRFRADLVLEGGAGPQWIDFKIGTVPDLGSGAWLERDVASGRRLQAALYSRMEGVASSAYVFLGEPERQELDPLRWHEVDGKDPTIERALGTATQVTASAVELGVAIPRLVGPDLEREGPWCRHCRVADACSRGDSGIRRRLVRWVEQETDADVAEAVARKVLRLGGMA